MQISIDTSRDSKEDIVKAIKLLESIIGDGHITSPPSRNIFDSPAPDVPQQSVFGSFFDGVNKPQPAVAKKDTPKIELY